MANPKLCSIPDCGKPALKRGWCSSHYQRWLKGGDPLSGGAYRAARGELLKFVHSVALLHKSNECLIWPFGSGTDGYGKIQVKGKTLRAPRLICELAHGKPPTLKHEAAHSCGNGHLGCVSPNHLRWATNIENHADRLIHGTHLRGERQPLAKLTAANVQFIRESAGRLKQRELAEMFGVTQANISNILTNRHWQWLRP